MNTINEKIRETLINAPSGVHTVFHALKKINNIETDERAIVYSVEKKLPLSAIPTDEIIPKNIILDEITYKTDVVEISTPKALQCNALNSNVVQFLRTYHRPLSGGLEIANLASIPFLNNGYIDLGTLGILAIDNTDNTLVGVTNNHVAIVDAFDTSERSPTGSITNTFEPFVIVNNGISYNITSSIAQWGSINNKNTNLFLDGIGRPKRYTPFSTTNVNTIDAALIALNNGVADITSACQAELANTYAMTFATTSEIEDILNSNFGTYPIYSVGRTTGPKGQTCPLEIYAYGSSYVAYNKQGVSVSIILSDLLFYRFIDQSNLPIYSGDSGSAVIANFNGVNKIIGLAFAGDTNNDPNNPTSTHGILCRIDNIVSALNISAWDGTAFNFTSNTQNSISHIVRPITDNRLTITYNGKTYYQSGLIKTTEQDTNA
jgi:hypothetical protein